MDEILKELQIFRYVAGPKINKDKTFMIWLGDQSKRWNLEKFHLKWSNRLVKYSGYYIHFNNDTALELEFEQTLSRLQKNP